MRAVFKADEAETQERYSVAEWWLRPGAAGPGAHLHEANDEIFYVLAGRPEFSSAERGSRSARAPSFWFRVG